VTETRIISVLLISILAALFTTANSAYPPFATLSEFFRSSYAYVIG